MTPTVPERIIGFLKKSKGTAYGADCIWAAVGLSNRTQAQLVTLTLGLCPRCQHDDKKLTKATRPLPPGVIPAPPVFGLGVPIGAALRPNDPLDVTGRGAACEIEQLGFSLWRSDPGDRSPV